MLDCVACAGILPLALTCSFGLVIASHLIYFIHGELNRQAGEITVYFLNAFIYLVLLSTTFYNSVPHGILSGTALFTAYEA
jgi:hypothetical protein